MANEFDTRLAEDAFGNLTALVPDWAVSSRVTAFCTTRLGGVSQVPYDSLNLGLHVGDNPAHVTENRRRLEDSFALPDFPEWLNQTHSTRIIQAGTAQPSQTLDNADGAWTDQSDTVVAVLTADCLPVVVSDIDGSRVVVVHAGWRGLADGILQNALSVFPEGADLHAWLGPAIGPQKFEIGEEVLDAFVSREPAHRSAFVETGEPGKYLANLYAIARAELRQSGSVTVTGGDYCTYEQKDWFHSYRRDGAKSGRMATVAWISAVG